MTERLASMLCLMCDRMLRHVKFRHVANDVKLEMKSRALLYLVKRLLRCWSQSKGKAFSYITRSIWLAFLNELSWQQRYDRRQKLAKDLVLQGLTQEEIYEMLYAQKDSRGDS